MSLPALILFKNTTDLFYKMYLCVGVLPAAVYALPARAVPTEPRRGREICITGVNRSGPPYGWYEQNPGPLQEGSTPSLQPHTLISREINS